MTECCVAAPLALEIEWRGEYITRLHLGWAEDKAPTVTTEAGRAVQDALSRYVAGEDVVWPRLPFSGEGLSHFARRVLDELTRVPRGQMVSYGWLAAKVGSPKAARAVGRVMAHNPYPLLVPCHRVVGASGALTGFGPGLDMKAYLLKREGALKEI